MRFNNLGKEEEKPHAFLFLKVVSSQANKRNTLFDRRSPQPPEVCVS